MGSKYTFTYDFSNGNIVVMLNDDEIFNAKTLNDTKAEIDVGGVKIGDLQTFSPDNLPQIDVSVVKPQVSNLNIAFNNTFSHDGVPFITEFKENYSTALDNMENKGDSNSTALDTIQYYQSFTKFLYNLKRSIGIAYMILTMYKSVAPESSTEFKDLDKKEKYLKKFLTDSVGLILNTDEWINNVNVV